MKIRIKTLSAIFILISVFVACGTNSGSQLQSVTRTTTAQAAEINRIIEEAGVELASIIALPNDEDLHLLEEMAGFSLEEYEVTSTTGNTYNIMLNGSDKTVLHIIDPDGDFLYGNLGWAFGGLFDGLFDDLLNDTEEESGPLILEAHNIFAVGETAVIGNWEVVLNSLVFTDRMPQTFGSGFYVPADGNVYLSATLTAENTGAQPDVFLRLYPWGDDMDTRLVYDDSFTFVRSDFLTVQDRLSTQVNPFSSITGEVTFSIAERLADSDNAFILKFFTGSEIIAFSFNTNEIVFESDENISIENEQIAISFYPDYPQIPDFRSIFTWAELIDSVENEDMTAFTYDLGNPDIEILERRMDIYTDALTESGFERIMDQNALSRLFGNNDGWLFTNEEENLMIMIMFGWDSPDSFALMVAIRPIT